MNPPEPAIKYLHHLPGDTLFGLSVLCALLTVIGYIGALRNPDSRVMKALGRFGYVGSALFFIAAFGYLCSLMYRHSYAFKYVFEHTGNDITFWWFRLAATWSGQEGSFALWGVWTALIGFVVMAKAGKYEARVMPFYVSVIGFLAAILLKESPFQVIPPPSAEILRATPDIVYPFAEGMGLNPSLQNYWMTIHPPTIFFGFASLTVPFVYAIAALIWKDYERWVARVMPYALLSTASLGLGLFMGGYWAYETLGWHGFWAWDPVENASFFPWLAVLALVHGLVVQKSRGGMARTNVFLGLLAFNLFLGGTFLTRSGVLAQEDANGMSLSVHAFANMESTALKILVVMLAFYIFGSVGLFLARLRTIPVRKTTGETALSRDLALFVAILMMIVACAVIVFGTTTPLLLHWAHRPPWQPDAAFYNKVMLPLAMLTSLSLGIVPWLAWKKTNSQVFLKKLLIPWFLMLIFGFFMVFWVQHAQQSLEAVFDSTDPSQTSTLSSWLNSRSVQRLAVVALSALAFFAALSNAMLGYRVVRAKPLSAGGWIAHVGMGLLILGVIVTNTYERTVRLNVFEGGEPANAFGYKIGFEKMTGELFKERPMNPDYDRNNTVRLRVTPPNAAANSDGTKTFTVEPRWFVHNRHRAAESEYKRMVWPHIHKFPLHDLYVSLANEPRYVYQGEAAESEGMTFELKEKKVLGPYTVGYFENFGEPGKFMGAHFVLVGADKKVIEAKPLIEMGQGAEGMSMTPRNIGIPELTDKEGVPGVIQLVRLDPATKAATVHINLPEYQGRWLIPLEVTYKPWINIVWLGVIIAVLGTLLAMVRRALEVRKSSDGEIPDRPKLEVWEAPEEGSPKPELVLGHEFSANTPPQPSKKRPRPQAE